jgi:predicted RecA/RadA family phage recombinase
MIPGAIQFNGDTMQSSKLGFINRTGGAMVKGGVYALDIVRGNVNSTSVRTALYNAVTLAAGNIGGILVVAETTTPDGEEGQGVVFGPADVRLDGTTDVAAGDRLKAVSGTTNLAKASAAVGSVDVGVAIALEARTADSVGLQKVIFDGFAFNKVINAAVS